MVVLAVELDQFGLEVGAHRPHDLLHSGEVPVAEHLVPELRHEDQVSVQSENAVSTSADAFEFSHKPMVRCRRAAPLQLPRVPDAGQQQALARAFGCARVVFNDGLRARQQAREAGETYLSDGELSKRVITAGQADARAGVAGRGFRRSSCSRLSRI